LRQNNFISGELRKNSSVRVLEDKSSSSRILEDNFEVLGLGLGLEACVLDSITEEQYGNLIVFGTDDVNNRELINHLN